MENRLNSKFCWLNLFHYGFKFLSLTGTADLKIDSQLAHLKKINEFGLKYCTFSGMKEKPLEL